MIWHIAHFRNSKRETLWKFLSDHGLRSEKKDFLKVLAEAGKYFNEEDQYDRGEFLRFLTVRLGKLIDMKLLIELEEKFESLVFNKTSSSFSMEEMG